MKRFLKYGVLFVLVLFFLIWTANKLIINSAKNSIYSDLESIPNTKVGILLGTRKNISSGLNLYYQYRIEAATELYKSGKITKLLISGDNSTKEYDEPNDMRLDLIANGIDSNDIVLDYAGFRTFDSIYRLKEIFGQSEAIVISQRFHNERAIYIATKLDIKLYGYNAKDVTVKYGFKTQLREYFARVKTILDFVLGLKPKFLGEKVII